MFSTRPTSITDTQRVTCTRGSSGSIFTSQNWAPQEWIEYFLVFSSSGLTCTSASTAGIRERFTSSAMAMPRDGLDGHDQPAVGERELIGLHPGRAATPDRRWRWPPAWS